MTPAAPLPALALAPAASAPARTAAPATGWRSRLFNAAFIATSFAFLVAARLRGMVAGRAAVARVFRSWARTVEGMMRRMLGIRVELRGRGNLPVSGAYILAAKHQSESDGILMIAAIPDIAVVAMKEVANYPLAGPLLRKLEMVLVDTDGGARERESLIEGGRAAAAAGRPILIYPEGTLMEVGKRGKYRAGVYHLAAELGLPVIPVATDIGLRWDRRQKRKAPGPAAVSLLPAMRAGGDKRAFMAALEDAIETESARLAAEHAGAR